MLVRFTIIYTLARVVTGILGIATTAILTRLLDPGRYGTYGFVLVIMLLVSGVGFDWLGPTLLRIYQARKSEPGTFATFVHLFVLVALTSAVVMASIWAFGGFPTGQAPVYLLGTVLAWAYSWFELVSTYEIANLRPLRYFTMNLSRATAILVGAGAAAWITHDPLWTAAFSGAGMLGGALQASFRNRQIRPRYFNRDFAAEVVGFGLPVAVGMTMLGMVNNGTRALLEMLDSSEALGLYTAAYALVQTSLMVVASGVASAGYSLVVRAVEGGDHLVVRRQILDNGTLLLAIMAPACLGLALTAHGFTTLLLGHEFRSTAVTLTPWMAAGAFFGSIRANFFDHAFYLGRRPIGLVWVMVVAATSAVGLSVLLIPRMGPVGAAVAVTAAMMISCCHAVIAGRSVFPMPVPVGAAVRILLCCGFMALIVLSVPTDGTMGFLMQVFLGAFGYGCGAIVLNVFDLRTRMAAYISNYKH